MHQGRVEQVGTPREIYSAPGSRFAAEFMGVANVLEARVAGAGGGAEVETPIGALRSDRLPAGAGPGDAVLVSIRPESFRLGAGPVRRRIKRAAFLGERAEYVVEAGEGVRLVVYEMAPRGAGREPGRDVDLAVDPEDVVVLAREPSR
jgi:iron(III) transport system ATP-binding protein